MAMNSIKMEPGSTPPVDGNEYKEYLMTLSIPELISNLRTAFRSVDFDRVVEVLAENETKLKYEIKALTEKLELETLVRMSSEEECKGRKNAERYEILPESVKKNNELDHENTLSELRIKNAKLEEGKRMAESATEFWKSKFEELSEQHLMVEKGVNSFMNGDAHVGIGGKSEDLSNIRGNTHPGVSDEVMDEKDMNVNDICDNEQGNTTAGSSPSQREDLKSGNTHVSTAEVSRQSPDSPNEALLGASGNNASSGSQKVVIEIEDGDNDDDDECISIASSGSQKVVIEIDDSDDDNTAAVDDTRRSSSSRPVEVNDEKNESVRGNWFPESGKSFDGSIRNLMDGSDTNDEDDSSTSSSSSLGFGINEVIHHLPSNFLCSIDSKRRKI